MLSTITRGPFIPRTNPAALDMVTLAVMVAEAIVATCYICGLQGQFILPCNCIKPIHKHCFVQSRVGKTGCLQCKKPYKHLVIWDSDYATTDMHGYVYIYRLNVANELDGPCQVYYPNHGLEFDGEYRNGKRSGDYLRYYDTGALMEQQTGDTYTMYDEQGAVLVQRKI